MRSCLLQVLEFKPMFSEGHGERPDVPSLSQVFDICYAMRFWLSWNPKGVAVLFDSTMNNVRSGFVVACFMAYVRPPSFCGHTVCVP